MGLPCEPRSATRPGTVGSLTKQAPTKSGVVASQSRPVSFFFPSFVFSCQTAASISTPPLNDHPRRQSNGEPSCDGPFLTHRGCTPWSLRLSPPANPTPAAGPPLSLWPTKASGLYFLEIHIAPRKPPPGQSNVPVYVRVFLTYRPSLGPHPSAPPHVSSRRCRCTLPSTPRISSPAGWISSVMPLPATGPLLTRIP